MATIVNHMERVGETIVAYSDPRKEDTQQDW